MDVSRYGQIRVGIGAFACGDNSDMLRFIAEEPDGSAPAIIADWKYCAESRDGRVFDVPGRKLHIICFCFTQNDSQVEVSVYGRTG